MKRQVLVLIIFIVLLFSIGVFAGSLTPNPVNPGPDNYSLSDIYNKLTSGSYSYSPHDAVPASSPSGTSFTLAQIWNAIPSFKTLIPGSLASGTIAGGIYSSSTDLRIIEPNLTAANIATGTTLFGITGTYVSPTRQGVMSYYPLDSDVNDYSGNSYNGTNSGLTPASGKIGGAYNFGGAGTYLSIPPTAFSASSSYSIAMWFNPSVNINNTLTTDQTLFRYADDNSYDDVYLVFNGGQEYSGGASKGSILLENYDFANVHSNSNSWTAGQWHYLVGTFSTVTGMKMYIDGVLQTSTSSNTGRYNHDFTEQAFIGAHTASPGDPNCLNGCRFFNGIIDEVLIYNRALSAPEVATLYNGGNGKTMH